MTRACPKVKLLMIHMYANTHSQRQTLVGTYTHLVTRKKNTLVGTRALHILHCEAFFPFFTYLLSASLSSAHTHTQTHIHIHTPSLSMQLKGPSLQGF